MIFLQYGDNGNRFDVPKYVLLSICPVFFYRRNYSFLRRRSIFSHHFDVSPISHLLHTSLDPHLYSPLLHDLGISQQVFSQI